jgi:BASS family bile acid:Na+ symporter
LQKPLNTQCDFANQNASQRCLSARTVALEVGLQNGGMASGLAGAMGKLGTVGLAAAIFSPWMNVSGSILANYWRRSPTSLTEDTTVPRL